MLFFASAQKVKFIIGNPANGGTSALPAQSLDSYFLTGFFASLKCPKTTIAPPFSDLYHAVIWVKKKLNRQ